MPRRIETYSMIEPSGCKRCFIDLVDAANRVCDREVSEGYTHEAVDRYADELAAHLSKSYGAEQVYNLGTVDRNRFNSLAGR